jgi:hypothetical protein
MARLAKEATTIRRVLEPLFQNFDANNHWSLEKGVAYPVLTFLQSLLVESGYVWNLMHCVFRPCVWSQILYCNSNNLFVYITDIAYINFRRKLAFAIIHPGQELGS